MRFVGLLVTGLLGGCTIVFNSNDLPRIADASPPDAHPDAPPIADATVFDVNPAGLTLTAVDPTSLVEGTGSAGGRAAVIVISGMNIDPGATVNIVAGDSDQPPTGLAVAAAAVSQMHDQIAATVTVPVIPSFDEGAMLSLNVVVTNPGGTSKQVPITITGLNELTATGSTPTSGLKMQYSQATFSAATHFTGTTAAHIRTTAGITISAAVDANGSGTTAGAGGCGGGSASSPGGCSPGGGAGGGSALSGVSGGGGGFGQDGADGGSDANSGGKSTGDPTLGQLDYSGTTAGNRGNGGGGGGGATLGLGSAGVGGGGGGTIELTAGGTLEVDAGGSVSVSGAAGTAGSGVGPGDGGGGSGGAILVRAYAGITGAAASSAWLSAAGGISGTAKTAGKGGIGGVGRVRIDTTNGGVSMMATNPTAWQGPAWDTTTPLVVQDASAMLPLDGASGGQYGVFVGNGDVQMVSLNGTTMKQVPVTLVPGNNKICAVVASTADTGQDPSISCIEVAYIPK